MRRASVVVLLFVAACAGPASPSQPSGTGSATEPMVASTSPGATAPVSSSSPSASTAATADATEDATTGSTAGPPGSRPAGFSTTSAVVTSADGAVCEICLWVAESNDQRSRGLMEVTDLGEADGMAFVYPTARTGSFWMKNTVMPLSIVFYGPEGTYLDSFDMEPCLAEPCRSYPTPPDFLVAVEVPQGELAEFGMAPGSTLELRDISCDEA